MGGGEYGADTRAELEAEQRGALDSDSVYDCPDVVHLGFERGRARLLDPIREAGAATIEDDNARERPQTPQPAGERLDAPHVLDVRGEARDDHEVERPFAKDLVGDVRAVRRLDVADLGRVHAASLAPPRPSRSPRS